jgi:hypothetical protein
VARSHTWFNIKKTQICGLKGQSYMLNFLFSLNGHTISIYIFFLNKKDDMSSVRIDVMSFTSIFFGHLW